MEKNTEQSISTQFRSLNPEQISINENHQGFMWNRSTVGAMFILIQIIENYVNYHK